ncbi:MAG: tRNA (guanosine(37)-N1)-methyltransferase TrmD [Chloroflexi bacterium]|nr:tRNA (guanosine(37)-N1)-methyltransferase TrmD [Chloroflexota bacterium]
MRIDIITLFPGMFAGVFRESILARAVAQGQVKIVLHNLREHGLGRHRMVDDYPYGGGPGMVLKPEPLFSAAEAALKEMSEELGAEARIPVILLTPQGRPFSHRVAQELSHLPGFLLLCGHYEGVDERVRQHLATDELSIGDYVLTGGEPAAMVVVDAVVRLLPEVVGAAAGEDSFVAGILEHPQYTRPTIFQGWEVPSELLSGNHEEVAKWRRLQSLRRTWERRPDLLSLAQLTSNERRLIERWQAEAKRARQPGTGGSGSPQFPPGQELGQPSQEQ